MPPPSSSARNIDTLTQNDISPIPDQDIGNAANTSLDLGLSDSAWDVGSESASMADSESILGPRKRRNRLKSKQCLSNEQKLIIRRENYRKKAMTQERKLPFKPRYLKIFV